MLVLILESWIIVLGGSVEYYIAKTSDLLIITYL